MYRELEIDVVVDIYVGIGVDVDTDIDEWIDISFSTKPIVWLARWDHAGWINELFRGIYRDGSIEMYLHKRESATSVTPIDTNPLPISRQSFIDHIWPLKAVSVHLHITTYDVWLHEDTLAMDLNSRLCPFDMK